MDPAPHCEQLCGREAIELRMPLVGLGSRERVACELRPPCDGTRKALTRLGQCEAGFGRTGSHVLPVATALREAGGRCWGGSRDAGSPGTPLDGCRRGAAQGQEAVHVGLVEARMLNVNEMPLQGRSGGVGGKAGNGEVEP
eukprot:9466486-Pyramimonas_sp.AAC.2